MLVQVCDTHQLGCKHDNESVFAKESKRTEVKGINANIMKLYKFLSFTLNYFVYVAHIRIIPKKFNSIIYKFQSSIITTFLVILLLFIV